MNSAGALYSKSVDLANTGNYKEALEASDQALALNVSSTIPLIQANRAGILVMLGRYEDAIAAADVAISDKGNIPTTKSIAWFNKGNALKSLGRISDAQEAYAAAHNLDSTLPIPELTYVPTVTLSSRITTTVPSPTDVPLVQPLTASTSPTATPRTPVSPIVVIGALVVALVYWRSI